MDMGGARGGTLAWVKLCCGRVGMGHGAMGNGRGVGAWGAVAGMAPQAGAGMAGREHSARGGMNMRDPKNAPQVRMGPGVQTIAPMAMDRTGEPGQGLENVGHKVLVYRDLMAATRNPDVRAPDRAMAIHLTANMERYMWSFDGLTMSGVKAPIPFPKDQRLRVTPVTDTLLAPPTPLHARFFPLLTATG